MQADKSIMLQKQIRDNSQDLQNEFLDMKNWEQQMKKSDAEIRNAGGDQILPPVRKKKKSLNDAQPSRGRETKVGDKPKRIKSSDYTSWDKFDVEKACEALDKESDDSAEEPLSKEELEKNHAEARKHKVQGNIFVQKQQWSKAIACYNNAIKAFPYDAVFFANRALCHLKIDNLHSAEADCTAALQLDESYVKAYYRRAAARIELKHYKEAVQDIKHVLKLEPSNKEAHSMLARANKSMETSKPPKQDNTRLQAVQPTFSENTSKKSKTGSPADKKHTLESEKAKQTPVAEKSKTKLDTVAKNDREKLVDSGKPAKHISDVKLPDWLPEDPGDVGIVEVITKPPHQRSKKPLTYVPINEIEFGMKKLSAKDSSSATSKLSKKLPSGDSNKKITPAVIEKKYVCEEIPEAPKTAIQFLLTWRRNKSTEFQYKYFKQIPPERIPTLFQDSMESNTFSEILKMLRLEFAKREEPIFDYLRYLAKVKRFRTLTMFMTESDKEDLQMLFNYSEKVEHQRDDAIKDLRVSYEI